MMRALLPLSSGILGVVAEYLPLFVLISLLVLVVVARLAVANRKRRLETDPQRPFTTGQRRLARRLAQGRCEQESLPFVRCRRIGAHADHWFPWSRGGASTDQNLVWACTRHNLAKSARVPTAFQTLRLEARRARYFPGDVSTVAGEWFESGNTRPQLHRSDW